MLHSALLLFNSIFARWALWAPAACLFAANAAFALTCHYPILYFDHWDIVPLHQLMQDGALRLDDLFKPHGTHWHAGGYALMLALAPLTGMTQGPEIVVSLVLALAALVALYTLISAAWRSLDLQIPALLFAVTALFLFSPDQSENWLWGWQISVLLNIAGAAATMALLSRRETTPLSLILAMLAAAIAIYSFATGLALLPAGLVVLWLKRPKLDLRIAAWVIFCIAIALHFKFAVMDAEREYAASITPQTLNAETLASLFEFSANLIGGSVARFSDGLPLLAFVLGIGAGLFSFWRMSPGDRSASAGLVGIALYGLGAAMLIAFGRLGFDHATISRYITFGNLFWIGIVSLAFLSFRAPSTRLLSASARALFCLLIAAKAATIANVLGGASAGFAHAAEIRRVAAEICETYPVISAAARNSIAASHQKIEPSMAYIAEHRLSIFRDCAGSRSP